MKGEKELELHMKTKIRRMEIPMPQSYQIFDMDGGNSEKKPTADREFQFVIDWQHTHK